MDALKRIKILDIPVDMVNMNQAIEILAKLMQKEGCSIIVTPNSEILVNATKDKELKNIINSADLIIPDGIGLVYASKILGYPLSERVTGIDFLNSAFGWLEQNNKSVYFLGGKPGQDGKLGVAGQAAIRIKNAFPNLKIVGSYHGYFSENEEIELVEKINDSDADFLCVALGAPKQEKFISRYGDILKPKVAIGVGGSLDVWAGTVKRAPELYQKHGLEWLYRFIQEPSRYKRMMALPLFMVKVLLGKKDDPEER